MVHKIEEMKGMIILGSQIVVVVLIQKLFWPIDIKSFFAGYFAGVLVCLVGLLVAFGYDYIKKYR